MSTLTASPPPDWSARQLEIWDLIAERQPRHVLLYGGSRSGKTYMLIFSVILRALRAAGSRHLVARLNHNAIRKSVMLGTFSDVMRDRFPSVAFSLNQSDQIARFPNGAEIHFSGLDSGERVEKLLGLEFVTLYLNEASQIPWAVVPLVRSRLAQVCEYSDGSGIMPARAFYDLNPSGSKHWTALEWLKGQSPSGGAIANPNWYLAAQINPASNPRLSPDYLAELDAMDSRRRARFLLGEFLDDTPGALWAFEDIDRNRLAQAPPMDRICVAIDPSISNAESADEAGIVAVGAAGGIGYAIADESGRYGPEEWARRAIDLFWRVGAGCIVAEQNQGGEMVRLTLAAVDPRVPVILIHAVGSKAARAVPVANLYRLGQFCHVGRLEGLEDEMVSWDPDPPRGSRRWSPGRIDALVHGARYCLPHTLGLNQMDAPLISGAGDYRAPKGIDYHGSQIVKWRGSDGL